MDLLTLEYPRHLHRPDGSYARVDSADAAEVAIRDGWAVDPSGKDPEPPKPDKPPKKKG